MSAAQLGQWGPWRVGVHMSAEGEREAWTVKRIGPSTAPDQFREGGGLMTKAQAVAYADRLNAYASAATATVEQIETVTHLRHTIADLCIYSATNEAHAMKSTGLPDKTITCDDLEQFAKLCALFVAQGVTFQGDAAKLHIYLTGGY